MTPEELAKFIENGWKLTLVRMEKHVIEGGELIHYTKEIAIPYEKNV